MRTVSADELARLRADPRLAVGDEAIVCLACGRAFRQLTNTHLAAHGLDAAAYKARYGYNAGRPLMCTALVGLYRDRARAQGLAGRIRSRPLALIPDLRRLGGRRE
ncbi:MAG TPA: MucR family transcriptional regulator, partial [Thermodesulfobacteriota bacterium]